MFAHSWMNATEKHNPAQLFDCASQLVYMKQAPPLRKWLHKFNALLIERESTFKEST